VTPLRKIQLLQCQELGNPVLHSVVALANETARAGYDALIFCSSQVFPELRELADEVLERRKDLLNELRSRPAGIDHILEKTILRGVAFHCMLLFSTIF
jgi:hypothetical protein